jgi:hypothetical protein
LHPCFLLDVFGNSKVDNSPSAHRSATREVGDDSLMVRTGYGEVVAGKRTHQLHGIDVLLKARVD